METTIPLGIPTNTRVPQRRGRIPLGIPTNTGHGAEGHGAEGHTQGGTDRVSMRQCTRGAELSPAAVGLPCGDKTLGLNWEGTEEPESRTGWVG